MTNRNRPSSFHSSRGVPTSRAASSSSSSSCLRLAPCHDGYYESQGRAPGAEPATRGPPDPAADGWPRILLHSPICTVVASRREGPPGRRVTRRRASFTRARGRRATRTRDRRDAVPCAGGVGGRCGEGRASHPEAPPLHPEVDRAGMGLLPLREGRQDARGPGRPDS